MDFNSLKDTVSNLTLYDIKAGVRKVQNAVMNYTEMEAKVREATNNEPWGASSTLMQEVADGTFNYATLNEIMPMIYRRFTEKSAEEWRQIYKALQLLEYLIKHGSERVVDDARSHLTLLKMLRQFHFIDQNGKDQGVNVRNRAKELTELLGDVERIRAERKKARANKGKFTGISGGMSFSSGSSGRYGGFGNTSSGGGGSSSTYGGYSGGVYGDGGGYGGQSSNYDFRETQARADQFEEYDAGDLDDEASSRTAARTTRSTTERAGVKKTTASVEPPKKKEPEIDLFSFDEPAAPSIPAAPLTAAPSNGSGLAALAGGANADDDEFDDFVSAAPAAQPAAAIPPIAPLSTGTQFAAPQPVSAPQQANLSGMVALSSISPPPPNSTTTPAANFSAFSTPLSPVSQAPRPTGYQAGQPNYFTPVQLQTQSTGSSLSGAKATSSAASKPAAGGDAFGALWSQASVGIKKSTPTTKGPAIGQLAKEKSAAGIWGTPAPSTPTSGSRPATGNNHGLDDLLG
ncbi:epsin-3 [Pseudoneurospora amorphoporcata]|uniref:Epsin-3 n=1 Tax=Pseudoneurospora amorphoporcata TaxID=241081 RepID=A0AAN6SFU4_9PEZI|nr:epsin-3 [Pseudoneurospora amorphoporcata]